MVVGRVWRIDRWLGAALLACCLPWVLRVVSPCSCFSFLSCRACFCCCPSIFLCTVVCMVAALFIKLGESLFRGKLCSPFSGMHICSYLKIASQVFMFLFSNSFVLAVFTGAETRHLLFFMCCHSNLAGESN